MALSTFIENAIAFAQSFLNSIHQVLLQIIAALEGVGL